MSTLAQVEQVAEEILSQVRATIVVNMRFLDVAAFRLKPVAEPKGAMFATDGDRLYYHPARLLKRYRREEEVVCHDYLHVLLHCIFRHPFVNALTVDHELWDLACDIAVEALICEFRLPRFSTSESVRRQAVIDGLRKNVKSLTAEQLYHRFQDHAPGGGWAALFHVDEHALWYEAQRPARQKQKAQSSDSSGEENAQSPSGRDSPPRSDGDAQEEENNVPSPSFPSVLSEQRQSLRDEWRDISEHMQMNLESFAKQQGDRAGGLQQQLVELNRERYDYGAFLRKFAVRCEAMQVDPDSFDYIFYTYGLQLYGNMPLIEPLEYREVKRIREFVIAIDTSGSTSGELVRKFLTKTYNILMSTESFFSKVDIRIIQCDTEIQDVVQLTSAKQLEDYAKHATVHGMGGTDFRPVFRYVDQLLRQGELRRLKGLIYFTDGWGTFPERKPDYATAFVFVQDEYNNLNVPPWAIKLILQPDEI